MDNRDIIVIGGSAKATAQSAGFVLGLREGGHDTAQGQHLVVLLQQILGEWETHRTLIEQRVAHLEKNLLAHQGSGFAFASICRESSDDQDAAAIPPASRGYPGGRSFH